MERTVTAYTVYRLLAVGGAIVATTFLVAWWYGIGTWEAWRVANVLHFIGGFYAFFFIRALFRFTTSYHRIATTPFVEIIIFISGALILGVLWEWFEFAIDRYRVFILARESLMTYADNMGDLITDTFGAVVAVFFSRIKKGAKGAGILSMLLL